MGHSWRCRDELISDVLQWTPLHGRAKAGQQARTYKQQLCAVTGCSPEDLLEAMNYMEGERERVRNMHADDIHKYVYIYIYIYIYTHKYVLKSLY